MRNRRFDTEYLPISDNRIVVSGLRLYLSPIPFEKKPSPHISIAVFLIKNKKGARKKHSAHPQYFILYFSLSFLLFRLRRL